MPSRTFRASAVSRAAPDEIWSRSQLPETWEAIAGVDQVFDPSFEGGELVGFKFHSVAAGRRYTGIATPGPREHARSLQWHISTSEIKGWIRVELVPAETSTRIDVTMLVESVSFTASLAFPIIAGAIANGFQETAEGFARTLEG